MTSSVLPRRRTRAALMGLSAAIVGGMIAAAPASAAFPGDNGKIAFSALDGGDRDVFTVDPDGQNLTNLTPSSTGEDNSPDWSADGATIAFLSDRGGTTSVWLMDADGGNPTIVPNTVGATDLGRDAGVSWSPSGDRIAFVRDGRIWTIDPDGGNGIAVGPTAGQGDFGGPEWSPDGSRIAFHSSHVGPDPEIFAMDADGSNVDQLTDNDTFDLWPDWTPTGDAIFWTGNDGNGEIFRMNADGSDQVQITTQNNQVSAAVAPDGTRFVNDTISSLVIRGLDGASLGFPFSMPNSSPAGSDWQPIVDDPPELEPLLVRTTTNPRYTSLHRWDLTKTPNRKVFYNHDKKHVAVDYTVKARKKNGGVRDVAVVGVILIRNDNDVSVPLGSITDALPGASCAVGLSPASIAANDQITIDYTCTFPNQVPAGVLTNTATVNYGDGELAQAMALVDFAQAQVQEKHNTVKVIDRLGDGPTKVLAAKLATSKTFTYRRYLKAPAKPSCVYHPNTAKVIGLMPNGELERDDKGMMILASATAKVRVCQKTPTPPSSEDPRPPSDTEDPPKVIITPGSSTNPTKPKPRPAVVKPSSEDPKPGVTRKAKLKLTQQARRRTMRLGQRNVLTIRVRNTGKKMARNVVIREKLPKQLRPLRTSKPNKTTIRNRKLIIKLGNLRPGKAKTVRVVVAAVGKPKLTKKVKLQASRMKNERVAQRMRYRARKGLACASAKVSARNARSRVAGVCVKIRSGKPRPEITIEDREDATPR